MAQSAVAIPGANGIDANSAPLAACNDFVRHRSGANFFPGDGTVGALGRAPDNPAHDFHECIHAKGEEFRVRTVEKQVAA